ncbi:MAG: DUF5680 domain-containing protein [Chloroflexota bacterium]
MEALIEFLVEARRITYAIPHGTAVGDGTQQMIYDRDDWGYRDRYAGYNPYGGHELVWHKGRVVWMKNYMAEVLSNIRPMAEIYAFQREVLGQPDPTHLMRGPAHYENGAYRYKNNVQGDLAFFTGQEFINYKGKTVYQMTFHGGTIGNQKNEE